MSNVLDETKQRDVIALGQLGLSPRRIDAATGVRRETVSGYLKAAGVAVRKRGIPRVPRSEQGWEGGLSALRSERKTERGGR